MMVLQEEYSPVILEVMAKSDAKSFDDFKQKVRASEMSWVGPLLQYETIYGDRLTFDTSYIQIPTINGKDINYSPPKAFESPSLNGDWNSGIVTISKGKRKKVLDFRKWKPNKPVKRKKFIRLVRYLWTGKHITKILVEKEK